MEDKIFNSSWIKKQGKLSFYNKQDETLFHEMSSKMREGQRIFFTVDFSSDNGKLSQI